MTDYTALAKQVILATGGDLKRLDEAASVIAASVAVAQQPSTINELAAWLVALEDASMYEPVPASLVEHGRRYIRAGLTQEHAGDCTGRPHSCVVCGTNDAIDKANQVLTALALTEGERQWVSPIKTVADLVNNLLTLDQGMEVHGAYFLPEGVPDRCRTRGLSLSREHLANGRIKRDDAVPYSLVIWTAQEGGQ